MSEAPLPTPSASEVADASLVLPYEVRCRFNPVFTASLLAMGTLLLVVGVMPIQPSGERLWMAIVLGVICIPIGMGLLYVAIYAGLLRKPRVLVTHEGIKEFGLLGNRFLPWRDLEGFQLEMIVKRAKRKPSERHRRWVKWRTWHLQMGSLSHGVQVAGTGLWRWVKSYETLTIDLGMLPEADLAALERALAFGLDKHPTGPKPRRQATKVAARGGSRGLSGSLIRALIQAVLLGLPLGGNRTEVLFLFVAVGGTLLTSYRFLEVFAFRAPRWTLAWLALVVLVQQGVARWIQAEAREIRLDGDSLPLAIATLVLCLVASGAMGWIYRADRPQG